MSRQQNLEIAQTLLGGMANGDDPDVIAAPLADDLLFEIQGDEGALPWIGRKTGRQAFTRFLRDLRELTEPLSFEVDDILAGDDRAAIIGALGTRIKATGRIIESQFAIVLTIADGRVTRFQMLEDSFAVSRAARHARAPESG